LYLRGKDATIKDLKFEILIHLSPNVEPLTPNFHVFPNHLPILELEALGGGLQMFFQIQK
jgi:hypothetical protein